MRVKCTRKTKVDYRWIWNGKEWRSNEKSSCPWPSGQPGSDVVLSTTWNSNGHSHVHFFSALYRIQTLLLSRWPDRTDRSNPWYRKPPGQIPAGTIPPSSDKRKGSWNTGLSRWSCRPLFDLGLHMATWHFACAADSDEKVCLPTILEMWQLIVYSYTLHWVATLLCTCE